MLVGTSQAGDLGSQVDKTKEDPRRPGPGRPHASATATISFVLFGGEGVVWRRRRCDWGPHRTARRDLAVDGGDHQLAGARNRQAAFVGSHVDSVGAPK